MKRLAVVFLPCVLGCGTPDSTTRNAPAVAPSTASSAEALPPLQSLDGPVIAVASDGTALVQRGTHVDVFSPDGRQVKQVALGDPAPKAGVRYAVSDKARYAARIDSGEVVELWDVAAGREAARIDTGEQSWGAPTFLGDALMATHHTNLVTLWELPSGKRHCTVKDPAIRLARESFAIGSGVVAVRGSANSPGVSNAVIVEFATQDCAVHERHLVSPREPARVSGGENASFVLSLDRLRMRSDARNVEVALPDGKPQALFATADGASVLWAGYEKSGEHVVRLWSPENSRLVELGRVQSQSFIAHVRIEGGAAFALVGDGRLVSWPLPPAGAGADAKQLLITADQLAREEAIIQLGLDNAEAALRALGRVTAPDAKAANRFLVAYVESLSTNEKHGAFRKRMKAEKIRYAGDPSTLAIASDLARAEVLGPAVDMFLFWLEDARPGSMPETAVELGLELALQWGEAHAGEPQSVLLNRLLKIYPKNGKVREALKDLSK